MRCFLETKGYMTVEKKAVSKSFSGASESYDVWAEPQRKIAQKLVELLPGNEEFHDILDLGCGTGNVIEQLLKRRTFSKVHGVDIADGMVQHCRNRWSDPYSFHFTKEDISTFNSPAKYDLILSSCVFQWVENFKAVIKNLKAHLKSGGRIAIAVLIEKSFFELLYSFEMVCGFNMPGLNYKSENYFLDLLEECDMKIHTAKTEIVYGYFKDINVLKYFKNIGATFQYNHDYIPLKIKDIHKLLKCYKDNFAMNDAFLPITHKVLYLIV